MGGVFTYPEVLADLYTSETIAYREGMNKKVHDILKSRMQYAPEGQTHSIETLLSENNNLIIPHNCILQQLQFPFDIIAVTGVYNGKSFMFTGLDSQESSGFEGIGKTALAWTLIGIELPIEKFPQDIDQLKKMEGITIPFDTKDAQMASSNATFVGLNEDGQFSFSICLGEIGIAQWDAARSVYRIMGSPIGDRKEEKAREYLFETAKRIILPEQAFVPEESIYPVDYLFQVRRGDIGDGQNVCMTICPQKSSSKALEGMLEMNPGYHTSKYWGINQGEHKKRVTDVLGGLKHYPKIITLDIQKGKDAIPIQKAAKVLRDYIK